MMHYQITKAAGFLYGIGVSYHATGTLAHNKVKLFDYYKVDSINTEQKLKILDWCGDAKFFNSRKQFAPELTNLLISFPKSAFYRNTKAQ